MKRTLLFEVGEGIGNNVHATGTIYAMLARKAFEDMTIYVRTYHPEIWTPVPDQLVIVHADQPSPLEKYTYRTRTLFGMRSQWPVDAESLIPPPAYLRKRFLTEHECDLIAEPMESFFDIRLDARAHRRVNIPNIVLLPEKSLIGLCDAGTRSPQWIRKKWRRWEVLARLIKERGFRTACFFEDEADRIIGCDEQISVPVSQLPAQIARCRVFVANDCGPLHIADVMHVPVIGIYGPTYLGKNRPLGEHAVALTLNLACQPCQGTELQSSCQDVSCMDIKPQKILNTIISLYHETEGFYESRTSSLADAPVAP